MKLDVVKLDVVTLDVVTLDDEIVVSAPVFAPVSSTGDSVVSAVAYCGNVSAASNDNASTGANLRIGAVVTTCKCSGWDPVQ